MSAGPPPPRRPTPDGGRPVLLPRDVPAGPEVARRRQRRADARCRPGRPDRADRPRARTGPTAHRGPSPGQRAAAARCRSAAPPAAPARRRDGGRAARLPAVHRVRGREAPRRGDHPAPGDRRRPRRHGGHRRGRRLARPPAAPGPLRDRPGCPSRRGARRSDASERTGGRRGRGGPVLRPTRCCDRPTGRRARSDGSAGRDRREPRRPDGRRAPPGPGPTARPDHRATARRWPGWRAAGHRDRPTRREGPGRGEPLPGRDRGPGPDQGRYRGPKAARDRRPGPTPDRHRGPRVARDRSPGPTPDRGPRPGPDRGHRRRGGDGTRPRVAARREGRPAPYPGGRPHPGVGVARARPAGPLPAAAGWPGRRGAPTPGVGRPGRRGAPARAVG
ncbi:hypothetical protein GA0070623_5804 [Micromonospora rifamycinica]|uniref:Uncharacterized protein n=1 Tax=Micromonospora rifamycinica TaxID=291594 RepID=A0A1C5KF62_9ACTN|nr:hypothetical protein GA0070623_5804 [Micromonospora rifamycinica]